MAGVVRLLASLLLVLFALPTMAQQFTFQGSADRPLDPEDAFRIELLSVENGQATIGWQIAPGYYLYRDHIVAATAAGAPLGIQTEPGVTKDDPNFGPVEVYYDAAAMTLRAGGDIRVTWQGCQEDGICYAPVTSDLALPEAPAGSQPVMQLNDEGGLVAGLAGRGGVPLVLLAFLGFGLALSLTPCVFPMIPILAGMLAQQGDTLTPSRGALLSGSYVLAMAAAFALFGAFAGWSGQNLQMALQSPVAVAAVALLFVALALSSFGLFEMALPTRLTARLTTAGSKRGSVAGAALLGFTSALIVGPCVTAPLAGAFLYIAQTGDIALGAAALFCLGLGQGVPLFIAGTFGARVLPRAGAWMQNVRSLFGVLFLGMAIWLAGRLLPGPMTLALWAMLLTGCAVFLGALDRLDAQAGAVRRLMRAAGIIMLMGGTIMGLGAAIGAHDPLRPLEPLATAGEEVAESLAFAAVHDPAKLAAALADGTGQASLIYVTAGWCASCKGIERSVLPDPLVQQTLSGMRLLKADVTHLDAGGQAMLDRLGAAGPPTMIFLDAQAQEPQCSRLVGTVTVDGVVASAKLARMN